MKELPDNTEEINTKEKFLQMLRLLISDLNTNPEQWENKSLESYLEAVNNWIADMDGYYNNMGKQTPVDIIWSVLADIFLAAKIYE